MKFCGEKVPNQGIKDELYDELYLFYIYQIYFDKKYITQKKFYKRESVWFKFLIITLTFWVIAVFYPFS